MHKHEIKDVTIIEAPVNVYVDSGVGQSTIVGKGEFQKDEDGVNILIRFHGEEGKAFADAIGVNQLAGFSIVTKAGISGGIKQANQS